MIVLDCSQNFNSRREKSERLESNRRKQNGLSRSVVTMYDILLRVATNRGIEKATKKRHQNQRGAVIKYTLTYVLWQIRKMTLCLFISPRKCSREPILEFRFHENWIRLIERISFECMCVYVFSYWQFFFVFLFINSIKCYLLFWIYPTECKTDDKLGLHTSSLNSQHRPLNKVFHHLRF